MSYVIAIGYNEWIRFRNDTSHWKTGDQVGRARLKPNGFWDIADGDGSNSRNNVPQHLVMPYEFLPVEGEWAGTRLFLKERVFQLISGVTIYGSSIRCRNYDGILELLTNNYGIVVYEAAKIIREVILSIQEARR